MVSQLVDKISSLVDQDRPFAHVIVVAGPATGEAAVVSGGAVVAGAVPIDSETLIADVNILVARDESRTLSYGDHDVFIDVSAPRPDLIIFGAFHIGEVLCSLAVQVGFRVTVVDPRPAFAKPDRFPDADQVISGWPDEVIDSLGVGPTSFVVSLLHDDRHEASLLPKVLATDAPYVGALGSRRTHSRRVDALRKAGVGGADISRIRGPIGLEIGAITPEEVALAILAEAVSVRRGDGADDLQGVARRIGEASG